MSDDTETAVIEQAQGTPAEGGIETFKPQADEAGGDSEFEPLGETPAGGEDAEGEDAKPKRPSGAQRLKRRNQALVSENAELLRRLDEVNRRQGGEADAGSAPREQDFNGDKLAFERAKSAYDLRQAVREEYRRRDEVTRTARQVEAQREHEIAYNERLDEARKRIPDFDEALKGVKGTFVRDGVIDEIMASEKGPLIAYHLAKDPDRLHDMNGMTSRELAREIGRLEEAVRVPASNRQTRAPAPLSALKGGAAQRPDLRNRSPEEYRKLRESGVS